MAVIIIAVCRTVPVSYTHLASVQYVTTPKLYHEYSTGHVLVMEYIDGYSLDDVESLQNAGYDMDEIGTKFVNNFIKQVMDDGDVYKRQDYFCDYCYSLSASF